MRKLQNSNFNISEYRSIGSWIEVEEVLVRERDVEVTGMIYGKGLRKTMKGEGGPDPGARTRGSGGMGGVLHSRMLAPGARGPDHGPGPGPGAVARRGDQFINVKVSGALDPRPRAQGPGPRPKPLSGSRAQFRVSAAARQPLFDRCRRQACSAAGLG